MKVWIAGVVSFGFVRAALANPLDSPGTVYIDGSPCNLPCQAYMAWGRQTLKANQSTQGPAITFAAKSLREPPPVRVSKRVEPGSADAPTARKAHNLRAALLATPERPPLPRPRTELPPPNVEVPGHPASLSTPSESPLVPKSETENVPISVEASNLAKERTPQQLVMAALAVAEQITNAETSPAQGNGRTDDAKAGDANVSISRVALLISRPDVKSASELKGLSVAIDTAQSVIEEDIRFALVALGAMEVRFSTSNAEPLDRLISGDVQAAVVKLVSADAAEAFPDIKGFKVLRVPLAPR